MGKMSIIKKLLFQAEQDAPISPATASYENKQVAFKGCVFILKSINLQQTYSCSKLCSTMVMDAYNDGEGTVSCNYCPVKIVKGSFTIPEVVLNVIVTKAAEDAWFVGNDDIRIVDMKGYVYSGKVLCEDIPYIPRATNCQEIQKNSRIDLVYVFPGFPIDEEVQSIQIVKGSDSAIIELRPIKEEDDVFSEEYYSSVLSTKKKHEVQEDEGQDEPVRDMASFAFYEKLNRLKLLIFKRFNNTLLSYEIQALDENIEETIYELSLEADSNYVFKADLQQSLIDDFHQTVESFRRRKSPQINQEEQSSIKPERFSDLLKMDPYQFEHFCASLLEEQGFEQIRVTRKSNDRGVDIIAFLSGERYVVQCKRYKDTVGSPEMQGFIGAMKNAGAEKGIYMTTGTFTREAELMARVNGVDLFDKFKLASLLQLEVSTDLNSTLWSDSNS